MRFGPTTVMKTFMYHHFSNMEVSWYFFLQMFIIMNAHLDTAPAAPGTIPRWCEQILHNPLYTLESANSITKFQLLMDIFRGQHSGFMSNRLHVW